MKKYYLFATAALLLGMSSCKTDSGTSTLSYSTGTYNLITSTSSPDKAVVSSSWYKYSFDFTRSTVAISSEIALNENSKLTVSTDAIPFKLKYYNLEGGTYEVTTIDSEFAGSAGSGERIRDLSCELTTLVYVPPTISGIAEATFPPSTYAPQYSIMEYYVGADQRVRTFWADMTFRGTTTSHYQGMNGVMTATDNKDIMYRVIMDLKKSTATVVLYNAKFSDVPQEPVKSNIVLKDLNLKFSAFGYEITGTDITPECYEGGNATPNANYKFDNFTLTSSGDLTDCDIDFSVAGRYNATFTGSYALRVGKTSGN